MKALLAPLQRLANIIEYQNEKIDQIHSVLTVDLKKAASNNFSELKKQTRLLLDIKGLLKAQSKDKGSKAGGGGGFKMPSAMQALGAGLVIVSIAAGLVAAAGIFMLMPAINPMQLVSALLIAAVFLALAPVFSEILKSQQGGGMVDKMLGGKPKGDQMTSPKDALKNTGAAVLAMISMAAGITVSSWILQLIMPVSFAKLGSAILIGLVFIPLGYAFGFIIKALAAAKIQMNPKGIGMIGMVSLAMAAIAVGISLVAMTWNAMMPDNFVKLPPWEWVIKSALILGIFAGAFYLIAKAVKGMSFKEMIMTGLVLPMMALAIVGVAFVFQLFDSVGTFTSPPLEWSLKAGLTLLIFSLPFIAIALIAKKLDFKAVVKTALAMVLISIAILGTAWIFSALDGVTYLSPPLDWVIASAIAITIFAIPLLVVSLIAKTGGGAVGILIGAAGIILIAGTMWVVAWIFSKLPDLSAISKNFTDAIMYPIDAMINVLNRFKNEIGIENLLPMAGGLIAIAAGWLALTAALAGQSIGGLVSGAANAIGDFLGFEGDGPADLLDKLAERKDSIIALGNPIKILGIGIARIESSSKGLKLALSSMTALVSRNRSKEFEKVATSSERLAKAFRSISASTRSMNVKAMNASSRMFEAIAKIAENDGEDAITVLAGQLLEAVEHLSETVDNLEKASESNQKGMKDALSGIMDSFLDRLKGVDNETGETPALFDVSGVIEAIEELEARFDSPLFIKK